MSIDSVDIIQAAEDYGEGLRALARRVIEARAATKRATTAEWPGAQREFERSLSQLALGSEEQFVRPGCFDDDDVRICDEDCGGYHP